MTIVVDASTVVAALIDTGDDGRWAESMLVSEPLAAPHLLPAEVANALRRAVLAKKVGAYVAARAYQDLVDLRITLFPYDMFSDRIWELRTSVTSYDAWYVALAEELDARLATLDLRLARARGPRCGFETPRSR